MTTDSKTATNYQQGGTYGTMRTCQNCHDQLSERGLGVVIRDQLATSITGNAKSDGGGGTGDLQRKPSSEMNSKKQPPSLGVDKISEAGSVAASHITRMGSARDLLLPMASMTQSDPPSKVLDEDNAAISVSTRSSESTEQFSGFKGPGGASLSGDFRALSITKQRLDEEKRRRENIERVEAEEAARLAAEEKEEAEVTLTEAKKSSSVGGGTPFRLKSRLGSSVRQWRGNLDGDGKDEKCSDSAEDCVGGAESDAVAAAGGEAARSRRISSTYQHPTSLGIRAVATESSSGIEEALSGPRQSNDATAKIHLGVVAADYLEKLTRELLQTDAPLLLEEIKAACEGSSSTSSQSKLITLWVNTLMTLATRCCATVEPDVKNGDLLGK